MNRAGQPWTVEELRRARLAPLLGEAEIALSRPRAEIDLARWQLLGRSAAEAQPFVNRALRGGGAFDGGAQAAGAGPLPERDVRP